MDITPVAHLMAGAGSVSAENVSRPEADDTDPRLLAAARDFEAMLLESWWRSMKETFGEDDSEVGGEAMDDLGIQAMSTAIAGGGGLGLAAALLEQLRAESGGTVPVSGEPETDGSPAGSGENVQSGENS